MKNCLSSCMSTYPFRVKLESNVEKIQIADRHFRQNFSFSTKTEQQQKTQNCHMMQVHVSSVGRFAILTVKIQMDFSSTINR